MVVLLYFKSQEECVFHSVLYISVTVYVLIKNILAFVPGSRHQAPKTRKVGTLMCTPCPAGSQRRQQEWEPRASFPSLPCASLPFGGF